MEQARPAVEGSIDPVQSPESTIEAFGIFALCILIRAAVTHEMDTQAMSVMHRLAEDE